jgi:hypothetical protein
LDFYFKLLKYLVIKMQLDDEKREDRERKLRALELRIRMRKYVKLKQDLENVKKYLINDIGLMENDGRDLPDELQEIKKELMNE